MTKLSFTKDNKCDDETLSAQEEVEDYLTMRDIDTDVTR